MERVCYQQWSKPRVLAKEHGTGEIAPAFYCWRAAQTNLIMCPSCQQTQRKIVTANGTARAGYSWEQRLDLSEKSILCYQPLPHHGLAKLLVVCCTSLYAWHSKKRAAINSVKTKLQYVSARDEAQSCEILSICNLCHSHLDSWKFSISF